jgi:hypothetical protein
MVIMPSCSLNPEVSAQPAARDAIAHPDHNQHVVKRISSPRGSDATQVCAADLGSNRRGRERDQISSKQRRANSEIDGSPCARGRSTSGIDRVVVRTANGTTVATICGGGSSKLAGVDERWGCVDIECVIVQQHAGFAVGAE